MSGVLRTLGLIPRALEATLARVAAVADPLQGAALRLGRMADRLPQRRTASVRA